MKKILLVLFAVLFLSANAKAADWVEFAPKTYFDRSTFEPSEYELHFWMKALYGSPIGPDKMKNGVKPWYLIAYVTIDCAHGRSRFGYSNGILYGTDNKILGRDDGFYPVTVYPESVADIYFVQMFCPIAYETRRRNGTENNYDGI